MAIKKNNNFNGNVSVRDHYGCTDTAVAFNQFMYWFGIKPDGFYKFKQPCKHPTYRQGDSWGEELGLSRKRLDPIFNRLVTSYKSKNEYLKASDKFAGKMFCSYFERHKRQVFYFMDRKAVDEFYASLAIEKKENSRPSSQESQTSQNVPINVPFGHSQNVPLEHSPIILLRNINTQTTTSLGSEEEILKSDDVQNSQSSQDTHIKMLEIFNKHTGRHEIRYKSLDQTVADCLANEFGGSLEEWEKHCEMISQNDFAMGRAVTRKNFRLWFKPAITEEWIVRIRNNHADRVAYATPKATPKATASSDLPPSSGDFRLSSSDMQHEINSSDEPTEIKQIRHEILKEVGAPSYESWLSLKKMPLKFENGKLIGTVVSVFMKDSITAKHENILKKHSIELSVEASIGSQVDYKGNYTCSTPIQPDNALKAFKDLLTSLKAPQTSVQDDYWSKYPDRKDQSNEARIAEWRRKVA